MTPSRSIMDQKLYLFKVAKILVRMFHVPEKKENFRLTPFISQIHKSPQLAENFEPIKFQPKLPVQSPGKTRDYDDASLMLQRVIITKTDEKKGWCEREV